MYISVKAQSCKAISYYVILYKIYIINETIIKYCTAEVTNLFIIMRAFEFYNSLSGRTLFTNTVET